MLAVASAINPIPSANINSQFCHALAHWFCIAKVAGFDLSQSCRDSGFCHFVPERRDPLDERGTPVLIPVVNEFDHKDDCSIKATNSVFLLTAGVE